MARARRAGRGNGRTGIAAWTFPGVPRFAILVRIVAFRESSTHHWKLSEMLFGVN
jgi:hypothetical protein